MAAFHYLTRVDRTVKLTVVLNGEVVGLVILSLAALLFAVVIVLVHDSSLLSIVLYKARLPVFYRLIEIQLDLFIDLKVHVMLDDFHFVALLALVLGSNRSPLDLAEHTVVLDEILSVDEIVMILV